MHFNQKFFRRIKLAKGMFFLAARRIVCQVCTGRRWRNRVDLPRGFARLVAENKKCTGSTKASVGNQSNFECCDIHCKWTIPEKAKWTDSKDNLYKNCREHNDLDEIAEKHLNIEELYNYSS